MLFPSDLLDLVYWHHEDVSWVAYERHSDDAYTIYVLKFNDTMSIWRACLSLDDRWTLSPVY